MKEFKKYKHKESGKIAHFKHIFTNIYRDEKVKIFEQKQTYNCVGIRITEEQLEEQYESVN